MDSSFAPSGRSERIGVSGVIPRRAGGPAFAAAGLGAGLALKPTAWPTIAVTCLAFESRIAAGPGVAVLHGNIPNLRAALDDAIGRGCSGIISFGIAGGLAPDLAPGAWVVASGVVAAHRRYPTDRDWARRLVHALGSAVHADIAGVDDPVAQPGDKRWLRDATASVAVDMESHIAAAAAEAHGLPFAACRVIIDPAHRSLPPAALIDLRPDGTPDIPAICPVGPAATFAAAGADPRRCRCAGCPGRVARRPSPPRPRLELSGLPADARAAGVGSRGRRARACDRHGAG